MVSKAGRNGGTFAHPDIAFEFASWISAEFKLFLIKEFQRPKQDEIDSKQLEWNLSRSLSKINYRIHTYSHLYGITTTGLRFFTVYGPMGRPDMAYYSFTKKILAGETIDVYNNGEMQRDFTYIDDIVEGITRVMQRPPVINNDASITNAQAPYKVYNIGNNQPVTLRRFITAIETACGKKAKENLLPMQPGDVPITYADVDELIKDTGFKPSISIEDGIAKFVDWYKGYYK